MSIIEKGMANVEWNETDNTFLQDTTLDALHAGISLVLPRGDIKKAMLFKSTKEFLKRCTLNGRIPSDADIGMQVAKNFLDYEGAMLWVRRCVGEGALYAGALSGTSVTLTATLNDNTGSSTLITHTPLGTGIEDPKNYDFGDDTADTLFYARDIGTSGNNIGYEIRENPDDDTTRLLYLYNSKKLITKLVISRQPDKLDGYGSNLYVENVLEDNEYLGAVDNVMIDSSKLPALTNGVIYLAGGFEGTAVTDADRTDSLTTFENEEEYPMRWFLDGGNATIEYAQAIEQLCMKLQNCEGLLSIPDSVADEEDPKAKAIEYRNNTGVSSSYCSFFYPNGRIVDTSNNRSLYVSPVGKVAGKFVSAPGGVYWQAIAGERELARLNFTALHSYHSKTDCNDLIDAQINVIRRINGNFYIFGNQTAQVSKSRLSKLHVRHALIELRERFLKEMNPQLFQFSGGGDGNTKLGLDHIAILGKGIISKAVTENILEKGLLVCDKTNNDDDDRANDRVNIDVLAMAKGTMEYIKVNLSLTNDSLLFTVEE